ncbi:MAG: hypothetical protein ACU841_12950 [Gammaproteobacteria bacterium]
MNTADGNKYMCQVQLKFENRSCSTGSLVLVDEVYFGTVPVEGVLLLSAHQALIMNSKKPITVAPSAKGFV